MGFLDQFLNNPLPSAYNNKPITEGTDGFDDDDDTELTGMEPDTGDDDDLDDVDPDEAGGGEDTSLSPEESAEADSIIDIAATPVIMSQVLSQEAVRNFVESGEFDTAVAEGFAFEGNQDSFITDNNSLFTEAKFYQQNMVRFTKQARTNQLFEICVQAIARAKGDPMYFKLAKAQKIRRKIKAILRERYKTQAMKKAREYIMRMKSSNSPTIASAARKIDVPSNK